MLQTCMTLEHKRRVFEEYPGHWFPSNETEWRIELSEVRKKERNWFKLCPCDFSTLEI